MAVTVKVCAVPAVAEAARPVKANTDAAAGATTMPDCVLANAGFTVSATLNDWVPAVFRVTRKLCVPPSAAVKV